LCPRNTEGGTHSLFTFHGSLLVEERLVFRSSYGGQNFKDANLKVFMQFTKNINSKQIKIDHQKKNKKQYLRKNQVSDIWPVSNKKLLD
jgi:hypothetical protein